MSAETARIMRERLAALRPSVVEIEDESHRHAGHEGAKSGGGHYRLHIVSPDFSGKNTVERHRLVYDALAELMRRDVHALSIRAQAPEEV
ncbi:MAG TPA: BolA family protein [Rhodocyclaceae bacterium]|jgi:BolA protein|nr:BolA family protein [Rhodocyclaceae bacterium]